MMVPCEPIKEGSVSKFLLMGVWEGKAVKMGWDESGVMGLMSRELGLLGSIKDGTI